MKRLFASLAKSDKKYSDPTGVLQAIVDDFGNPIQIGEQKDIGEFNNNFLARIQEGLNWVKIMEKLKNDAKDQQTSSFAEPLEKMDATNLIQSRSVPDVEMLN